jgi:CBS domain-containing protein
MASRQVAQNKTNPLESALRSQRLHKRELRRPPSMKRLSSTHSARALMTAPVVTVRPEESVENAARLMSELDCGALPVVDSSGRLIGIIACSDITTRLIARGITVQYAQVSDCMTHQAFACSLDSSTIEDCIYAMSWHQVKRMPIVDNDHRVIGIVSMSDVGRHLCEERNQGRHIGFAHGFWQLAGHAQLSPNSAG